MRLIFKYSLVFLSVLVFDKSVNAQAIPQGFKYQTIIRDVLGLIVPNQSVNLRFSFYSGSATGTLQWQETKVLFTDSYGLADVVVGTGTSTGLGLVSSFSQINWSGSNIYLKISIDASGGSAFTDMGATQLFSIPYAFQSAKSNAVSSVSLSEFNDVNLSGISINKVLKYNGSFWVPAIDNDSDTILFAYNSLNSVLSDTATYAFSSAPTAWRTTGNALGTSLNYIGTIDSQDFVVSSNNTERVRLKSNGNLFLRNPINSASVSSSVTDGILSTGVLFSGSLSKSGAGDRMIWFPGKASFRSGYVGSTEWDSVNVGYYSCAVGMNTKAGVCSFSSGSSCFTGDYGIAMGRKSKATALGAYPGGNGIALGDSCTSIASRCVAIGKGNYVDINAASIAIGVNNKTTGAQAAALGTNCLASGNWSTVIGFAGSSNAKNGCFVYSDASSSSFANATIAHQFMARASGGVIFYTDSARTMGVSVAPGSGSWTSVSDKNKKENFKNVDTDETLKKIASLKIKSWNYKSQKNAIRHIGPMAQDFYKAFGLGENNITISGIDMDGVILKGIQALNFRIENVSALNTIDELKRKITEADDTAEMNKRLDIIEAKLDKK